MSFSYQSVAAGVHVCVCLLFFYVLSQKDATQLHTGGPVERDDIGKRVRVSGYPCGGVLRFFGKHAVRGTACCGVELDQPLGKNSGTVGGCKYFECDANHGVLVIASKVTLE